MNELDLIRSFRADTPAPSAAASARAERAWRRPQPRRPRWAPRVAVAAGLAAAASAAALILPSDQESRLGTQPASAAETLRHAAAVQVGGVTRPLRPGEIGTCAGERRGRPAATGRGSSPRSGRTGSRRTARGTGAPGPSGSRTLRFQRIVSAGGGRPAAVRPAVGGPGPGSRAALPRRCRTGDLRAAARAAARPRGALPAHARGRRGVRVRQLRERADLHGRRRSGARQPDPRRLRGAILRAAALIPGISSSPASSTSSGRPGVGVAFEGKGGRHSLVFDQRTYELLGENDSGGGSADLESAIVDSPNERP